jgi:oxygen-independent coproporphyrinogen-3 oxidase
MEENPLMKIHISGIDQAFQRGVDHVIRLFFEEVELVFDQSEQVSDIQLQLEIENGHASAELTTEAGVFCATADRVVDKQRYALHDAVLQVFEAYTGIIQPWGVLTGIRPTKLLHNAIVQGQTPEQFRQFLAEEYKVKPEKIALMEKIVARQLTAIPDLHDLKREVSVYIGIPFCPTKCAYCTFPAYDIRGSQGSVGGFLGGLHYEVRRTGEWLKANGVKVTTIYFGGGTPTSITAEEMDALYAEVWASFPNPELIREVTVEAGRPDTITPDKIEVLKKYGIHRISINPQSYTQATLDAIGRHHTVEETVEKFHLAREMGMSNINMDLIIGLPGEQRAEFSHTLDESAKLLPESITVHTLSFKRASEMTQNREKFPVASRSEVQHMMQMAADWTERNGYAPYYLYRQKNILGNLENVGYALPGLESLYNIIIMEEVQTIIGLGCGAASKWIHTDGTITRFANPKEPKAYNDNFVHYTEAKLKVLEQLFQD